jgi:hypothetical protein
VVVVDAEPALRIRWTAHAAETWGRSHRMVQVGGRGARRDSELTGMSSPMPYLGPGEAAVLLRRRSWYTAGTAHH